MSHLRQLAVFMVGFFLSQCIIGAEIKLPEQNPNDVRQKFFAEPFVNLGGRFYYFEPVLTANWYEAYEFCRRLGMFLVSVETAEENQLIVDHIASIGAADYWTSGNELANMREYVWASTGERVTFTDWAEGEPNHVFNNTEHCIHYFPFGKWNDLAPYANNTEFKVHFICEEP